MKILLVEDEAPAVKRLTSLLKEAKPEAHIVAALESIEATVNWLKWNDEIPDLIFMDIHLSDGNSFLIFEQVEVKSPVIFATAYDEYAVRAFRVNSIDYLLKPILKEDLVRALDKFTFYSKQRTPLEGIQEAIRSIKEAKKEYKQRFLVRYADRLIPLHVEKAKYFCAEDKEVFMQTEDKKYAVDFTLDQLEELLDPKLYFRLNRKYIGQIHSIDKIFNHLNGKLKLVLSPSTIDEVFVSRERANEFKAWLET